MIIMTTVAIRHQDDRRTGSAAACCPSVVAGWRVPAIRSESLSRLVAGTGPAMTVGWTPVHRDLRSRCARMPGR